MVSKEIKKQLPCNSIFNDNQLANLVRFVNFSVSIYSQWWLTSTNPTEAPRHDLEMQKKLHAYRVKDSELAQCAIRIFKKHDWYLKPEIIPLCLFDEKLDPIKKKKVASKIILEKNVVSLLHICWPFSL